MMKHYLNLEKEVQLRDYDGIIGHITIAMMRYIFLSFEQRCHDDPRTLGNLFHACSKEIKDLTLIDALQRLLALALDKVRSAGEFSENVVISMVNAIMSAVVDFIQTFRDLSKNNIVNSTC